MVDPFLSCGLVNLFDRHLPDMHNAVGAERYSMSSDISRLRLRILEQLEARDLLSGTDLLDGIRPTSPNSTEVYHYTSLSEDRVLATTSSGVWQIEEDGQSQRISAEDLPGQRVHLGDKILFGSQVLDVASNSWTKIPRLPSKWYVFEAGQRVAFFARKFEGRPAEVWQTDGTESGTKSVGILPPFRRLIGATSEYVLFTSVGGTPVESWLSSMAIDSGEVQPLTGLGLRTSVLDAQQLDNGSILFWTDSVAVWRTDGTVEGTQDLTPVGGIARSLTSAGDLAFFNVGPGKHDRMLHVTDGTLAGTAPSDLSLGIPTETHPEAVTILGDQILYAFRDSLMAIDSEGNHQKLASVNPEKLPWAFTPYAFETFDDKAVFTDSKDTWVTDGTVEGTVSFTESLSSPEYVRQPITLLGDSLVFSIRDDDELGLEPWISDGTPAGTRLIEDMSPGRFNVTVRVDDLMRVGEDGILFTSSTEPFRSSLAWFSFDGSPVRPISELSPELADITKMDFLQSHTNTEATFRTMTGRSTTWWHLDISNGVSVTPIEASGRPLRVGEDFFYLADEGFWKTDGTTAYLLAEDVSQGRLYSVNDQMLLQARIGDNSTATYTYNVEDGMQLLVDRPVGWWRLNGEAIGYERVSDDGVFQIWRTDGTMQGTEALATITTEIQVGLGGFAISRLGDGIAITARNDVWVYDPGSRSLVQRSIDIDFPSYRIAGQETLFAISCGYSDGLLRTSIRTLNANADVRGFDDLPGCYEYLATASEGLLLKEISNDASRLLQFTVDGEMIYLDPHYVAIDGIDDDRVSLKYANKVYVTDGSALGTYQVEDYGHARSLMFTQNTVVFGELFQAPIQPLADVNRDGFINTSDIDTVFAAIRDGVFFSEADFDDDGQTTEADANFLIDELMRSSRGDLNLDGEVNFADILRLSVNFGANGGWADGDMDGDLDIDFQDFALLSANFGFVFD